MNNPYPTIIATVISSIVAGMVAVFVSRFTVRSQQRRNIHDQVTKLIDFSMQYPLLEDEEFCNLWPNVTQRDDKMRYDNYCCFVFNLLEDIWTFAGGNRQKMRAELHVEELIWRHRIWWAAEVENKKGYIVGFRGFVDSLLKDLIEKERKNGQKSHPH